MFRPRLSPADRTRPLKAPFNARTCEESSAARNQSILFAACNSASITSCMHCQTSASFHSRSLHQHVEPDPNPNGGQFGHERVELFRQFVCDEYAAARRSTSVSCSSSLIRQRVDPEVFGDLLDRHA
ncbi:hypothetical protein ACTG9Q_15995 [Actinokineospora sp. 24-640]